MRISIILMCAALCAACGTAEPPVEPLPPQQTGNADLALESGSFSAPEIKDEELVYVPIGPAEARLSTAKVVRFVGQDGTATTSLLFADSSLDDVTVMDPFGDVQVLSWWNANDRPPMLFLQREGEDNPFSGTAQPGPTVRELEITDLTETADGRLQGTISFTQAEQAFGDTVRAPSLTVAGTFDAPVNTVEQAVAEACNTPEAADVVDDIVELMEVLEERDLDSFRSVLTPDGQRMLDQAREEQGDEAVAGMMDFVATPPEQIRAMCAEGQATIYRAGHLVRYEYDGFVGDEGATESGSFIIAWQDGGWKLGI